MPKEFTEVELNKIKERFQAFKKENPELKVNVDELVDGFSEIIEKSNHEPGEEKLPYEQLLMAKMVPDGKVLDKYHVFYAQTLKGMFDEIGKNAIQEQKPVDIKFESYMNYENFMRGMFKDFVDPYLNQKTELKDYRFGRMNGEDIGSLSSLYGRFTAEWRYRREMERDPHSGGLTFLENLNVYMQTYPVNSKIMSLNKEDVALTAAVMYKCAKDKYNEHKWWQIVFFPSVWGESRALSRAKSYIQALRTPAERKERTFDDFVRFASSASSVDTDQVEYIKKTIADLIADSKDLDKENPDNDLMNQKKENLEMDLYGDEIENVEIDLGEKEEIEEKEDIIDTGEREEEIEKK